jgi:5'-nucleotidase
MPHFLVTNDDGVFAPGLLKLAQSLRQIGSVTIIAPDRNWSAAGHVKTMHRPLRVKQVQLADQTTALATDGAPSDCVAVALLGLVKEEIDMVISGINPNANLGHDVTYSGTVTAALEAVIGDHPGIAVSLDSPDDLQGKPDFSPAAEIAAQIIKQIFEQSYPKSLLLNMNIPYGTIDSIKGVKITRQGKRVYRDELVERIDPHGRPYYWIGGKPPTGIADPGTDFGALAEGFVSITPLQLSLTDQKQFEMLEPWNLKTG